jgi:hypothetical protein
VVLRPDSTAQGDLSASAVFGMLTSSARQGSMQLSAVVHNG